MSLIGDALRRARSETSRGEHQRRGMVLPTTPLRPRRRRISVPLVIGGILLSGVLGATATWLVITPADTVVKAAPVEPERAPDGTGQPVVERSQAPVGDSRTEAPPARAAANASVAAEPTPVRPATAPSPAPAAARPEPTAHEPHQTAAAQPTTHEFVVEGEVDGVRLHLDWLVSRPGAPFGRINGQDVIPGSEVEGFRVDEITADFVRLTAGHRTVILKTR